MAVIEAHWDRAEPRVQKIVDAHTPTAERRLGGGMSIGTRGVRAEFGSGRFKAHFHYTKPGMHALYYATHGTQLFVGERKWDVYRRLAASGLTATVKQADEGVVYVFDGARVRPFKGDVWQPPRIVEDRTLETAGPEFFDLLCRAAEEIYTLHGRGEVGVLLSAGTDSTLTLLALQTIGADFKIYTVGRSWDDFDPRWAWDYAAQLGLEDRLTLVTLPESEPEWQALLETTLGEVQQSDFSNVLMALCTARVREQARQDGVRVIYHGHFADDLLGNGPSTTGGYRKRCWIDGLEPSAAGWRDYRASWCMHTIPNNLQVAKVSRVDGMDWRCLFIHPDVIDYALSCPLTVTPVGMRKHLYWKALEGRLEGVWARRGKVGYYTGAGIGTVRREQTVLQDDNIRSTYARAKERACN